MTKYKIKFYDKDSSRVIEYHGSADSENSLINDIKLKLNYILKNTSVTNIKYIVVEFKEDRNNMLFNNQVEFKRYI